MAEEFLRLPPRALRSILPWPPWCPWSCETNSLEIIPEKHFTRDFDIQSEILWHSRWNMRTRRELQLDFKVHSHKALTKRQLTIVKVSIDHILFVFVLERVQQYIPITITITNYFNLLIQMFWIWHEISLLLTQNRASEQLCCVYCVCCWSCLLRGKHWPAIGPDEQRHFPLAGTELLMK